MGGNGGGQIKSQEEGGIDNGIPNLYFILVFIYWGQGTKKVEDHCSKGIISLILEGACNWVSRCNGKKFFKSLSLWKKNYQR